MTQKFSPGSVAIASGATAGWGVTTVFGNVGVAAGGTAVGVGALPLVGAGAMAGAAGYGAYRGLSDGDPVAWGAMGVGAAAGVSLSAGIGGVGVVGGFGGIGLGLGAMGAVGGVAGLGIYGLAKMLDAGPRESAFEAFDRMEERIDEDLAYSMAYTSALIELFLPEEDRLRQMLDYDVDADLQALKQTMATASSQALQLPPGSFGTAPTEVHHAPTPPRQEAIPEVSSCTIANPSPTATWVCLNQLLIHQSAINDLVIHPQEASLFIASDDGGTHHVDLSTRRHQYSFPSRQAILAIAFQPQTQSLLTGGETGYLDHWNVETRQLNESLSPGALRPGESRLICAMAAGHRSPIFASAGSDRTITLWCRHELYRNRYRTKRQLTGHQDTIFSLAFTPDERYLISASADASIRVWDLQSWRDPLVLQGHQGAVNRAIACPSHPLLVSAGQDATLRFWDWGTGNLLKTVTAHRGGIRFLTFSPDGSRLVSSGNDGFTRIWQLVAQETGDQETGDQETDDPASHTLIRDINLVQEARLNGCGPVQFEASGQILVLGDRSGQVSLWQRSP